MDDEDADVAPSPPTWPESDLVAVAAPSGARVIVAGRDGRIHGSDDAGASWTRSRTPVTETLADLAMADADAGWAVGPGTILRTEDGGEHWERQRLPGRAADWKLVAVGALDEGRAVALAEGGRWLSTVDGGGVWRASSLDVDPAVSRATPARLEAIDCTPAPVPRCWAVGDRVLAIEPGRDAVTPRGLTDAAGLAPFQYREGGVELSAADAQRLREEGARLARRPVTWEVEAYVTVRERRRFAEDQDPSALFDRIEARAREVVGHLEAAGVDGDHITVSGAPPWGYEDHLDDDSDFLERYWAGRLAPIPSTHVRATEHVTLLAVVASESGIIVADEEGRVYRGDGQEEPLHMAGRGGDHGLLSLARAGDRWLAVGRQGSIVIGAHGPEGLVFAPADLIGPSGALFDTFRSLAVSPSGGTAWAVGDAGRIARSSDGGHHWRLLDAPTAP